MTLIRTDKTYREVYFNLGPFPLVVAGTVGLELLKGDKQFNILEAHFDFLNSNIAGANIGFLTFGSNTNVNKFLSPIIDPAAGLHIDLTFGTGVPLDLGIFASGFQTGITIQAGYAILQYKQNNGSNN